MTDTQKQICHKILAHYGIESQRRILIEECAELRKENARLEELYQKSVGVIAATDCAECKNKVYRKAYNDVMKLRACIQEIIEDVRKKDGGAENGID